MASFQDKLQRHAAELDKQASQYPVLNDLEKKTGVPKIYAIAGVGALYFLMIFLNYGGQLLCNLIGFLLPSYYSIIAIESSSKVDDTQWLTYWTVFGFLSIIEYWSNTLLYWLPFYYLFKVVFILWLALPQFGGATYLYHVAIRPIALKYIIPASTGPSDNLRARASATTTGSHVHAL